MILIFSKDDDNLSVKMATGTVEEDFSYVKMIKNLLVRNEFDDTVYDSSVSQDEKDRIKQMLIRIKDAINTDED